MANIFDVAKYVLNEIGEISTMKLQKLCYYSQVMSYKIRNTPLFSDDFEAWANGPVCRNLFNIHRGKFSLQARDIPNNLLTRLTIEEKEVINTAIEDYGRYTGAELSSMTHAEEPWIKARDGIASSKNSNRKISKTSIKNFYCRQIILESSSACL